MDLYLRYYYSSLTYLRNNTSSSSFFAYGLRTNPTLELATLTSYNILNTLTISDFEGITPIINLKTKVGKPDLYNSDYSKLKK